MLLFHCVENINVVSISWYSLWYNVNSLSLSCASSGYEVEVFRRIIEGTNKTASDGELLLLLHRSECKPITRPAVISYLFFPFFWLTLLSNSYIVTKAPSKRSSRRIPAENTTVARPYWGVTHNSEQAGAGPIKWVKGGYSISLTSISVTSGRHGYLKYMW